MRDPKTSKEVLKANIWWRQLKNDKCTWACFWKFKYGRIIKHQRLSHVIESFQGSTLWNMVWKKKILIQDHCFWEVWNGLKARFWMKSWH